MNQFDELFEFRFAHDEEIDSVMTFISNYWGNPNHILATDKDFFLYEYCPNGYPNVYIAVEKKSKNIAAMQCMYFYEKQIVPGKTDMSTGMFLANPTCRVPFIGMELHKRVLKDLNPRSYIAPGVNVKTSAPLIKRLLHHRVERMKQFYIPGNVTDTHIAKYASFTQKKTSFKNVQKKLVRFESAESMYYHFDDSSFQHRKPYKDKWYVNRRYFSHPIYRYELYGISDKTVLVCREVSVEGSKAFRIVDILGDPAQIRFVGEALKELITVNNYEYIDIYEQQMNDRDLLDAGFIERTENDDNVIPNYFEPFLQKNIEIWVNRRDDYTFCFKADGDQDRPNHR